MSPQRRVAWKDGARIRMDAEAAYAEISHRQDITPAQVVRLATDPASAWHAYFEWDDRAAAQAFRLEQARWALRSFVFVHEDKTVEPVLVSVATDDGRVYRPYRFVLAQPDGIAVALAEVTRDLRGAQTTMAQVMRMVEEVRDARAPAVRKAARHIGRAVEAVAGAA